MDVRLPAFLLTTLSQARMFPGSGDQADLTRAPVPELPRWALRALRVLATAVRTAP